MFVKKDIGKHRLMSLINYEMVKILLKSPGVQLQGTNKDKSKLM
jgi:hypothetical protein